MSQPGGMTHPMAIAREQAAELHGRVAGHEPRAEQPRVLQHLVGKRRAEAFTARRFGAFAIGEGRSEGAACEGAKGFEGDHEDDLVPHRCRGDARRGSLPGGLVARAIHEEDDSSGHGKGL